MTATYSTEAAFGHGRSRGPSSSMSGSWGEPSTMTIMPVEKIELGRYREIFDWLFIKADEWLARKAGKR